MIEAGLRQRRSDTITCAIYCIVILFLYMQAELNVIDSGTAVL